MMFKKGQTAYSLINGTDHDSHELLSVRNPADDSLLANVTQVNTVEADFAVEVASECFEQLKKSTAQARSNILYKWYQLIMDNQSRLAELVTLEQGKPIQESKAEVVYAAGYVRWFAQQAERVCGTVIPAHTPNHQITTHKQGVGVVLGITPWNFPLAMVTRKVAPAYAAGCSFILKPSELTPLSAIELAKLALQAGMEQGAFQVLVSDNPQALIRHLNSKKIIRKLTFTGSTQVGKLLYAQCVETMKRASLELGGNAPFIVFDSANIESAIDGLMIAKFRNAGQTCIAANRVFVHRDIKAEFLEQLIRRVDSLKVGNGLIAGSDIGPLINQAAKTKACELVEDAIAAGANCIVQNIEELQTGAFMSPVILDMVVPDMKIFQSEIFAPVVSIIEFDSELQVTSLANAVDAGLAAYVYSASMKQVSRVSNALNFGMVGINEGAISNPAAPFGGMKESGLGREGGIEGIDEYLETRYFCQHI
ncbi:NAD-dependent succinate-semialdehyde dehydrogenase [Pseudoalteromonas sp. B95]|nr:NAD-dependent succinate-semialdehyde dehydrogenase [Pseudoalteromonas sp. B95]MDK1288925.1 NAD-dependent succinate-semialdehyde dehydrogenase [Pseudoalteromonas sp. B95]